MNYEDMSDYEINKAASQFIDFGDVIVSFNDDNETVYLLEKDGLFDMLPVGHFEPCNNPSDAWPIIVGNQIGLSCSSLQMDGYIWQAGSNFKTQHRDKNPLRAAMICFLKMQDQLNK